MSRPKGPSLPNLKEFKAPSKEAIAEQRRQMDAELSDNPQFRRALHQVERLNGNVNEDGTPAAFPTALPFAEADATVADTPRADDVPRTTLEGLGDGPVAKPQAPAQSQPARDDRAKTILGLGNPEHAEDADAANPKSDLGTPESARFARDTHAKTFTGLGAAEQAIVDTADAKRVTAHLASARGEPSIDPASPTSNKSETTAPSKRARRWIAGAVLAAALLVGGIAIGWSRLDSSAATSATNTTSALTNGTAATGSAEAVATAATAKAATATAVTASTTVASTAVPSDTAAHTSRASVEPMRSESARPSTTHEPAASTSRATVGPSVTGPPPIPPPPLPAVSSGPSAAPPPPSSSLYFPSQKNKR